MSLLSRKPTQHRPAQTPSGESQDVQRHRRRHWLRVHYDNRFDLAAEIGAIVGPLAAEISYLPHPLSMRGDAENLADAVHELLSGVVGMLAESRHLDATAWTRTSNAVRDLAQRPREPQITDDEIIDGSWAQTLTDHVAPFTGDLAAFLDRALPPRSVGLTGPSASERLEAALRVLDSAALVVGNRIPRVAARQALGTLEQANAAARAAQDERRAQLALARLGIRP